MVLFSVKRWRSPSLIQSSSPSPRWQDMPVLVSWKRLGTSIFFLKFLKERNANVFKRIVRKENWRKPSAIRKKKTRVSLLKGLGHEIEIKFFDKNEWLVLGLTKNLYRFFNFQDGSLISYFIYHFPVVKLKIYWRNNIIGDFFKITFNT